MYGTRADYGHLIAAPAIDDFAGALDGGTSRYDELVGEFVRSVYRSASNESAVYFLDKTPRYYFIVDELVRLFPEAKFVFLWRNPLAALASALATFRLNRFEPYDFATDLVLGPRALAAAFENHGDRAHAVRFEDLVADHSEEHWQAVFEYLELEWDPRVLERFSHVELQGRFGDPTGVQRYSRLSAEPLDKWRQGFRGPVRQAWVARYLKRLGREPLLTMGYDPDQLLAEARGAGSASFGATATDALLLAGSAARLMIHKRAMLLRDAPRPLGPLFEAPDGNAPTPAEDDSLVR